MIHVTYLGHLRSVVQLKGADTKLDKVPKVYFGQNLSEKYLPMKRGLYNFFSLYSRIAKKYAYCDK